MAVTQQVRVAAIIFYKKSRKFFVFFVYDFKNRPYNK